MNRRIQLAQGVKRKSLESSLNEPLSHKQRTMQTINDTSCKASPIHSNYLSQSVDNNHTLKQQLLKCLDTIRQFQQLLNSECNPARKNEIISKMKAVLSKIPKIDSSIFKTDSQNESLNKLKEIESLLLSQTFQNNNATIPNKPSPKFPQELNQCLNHELPSDEGYVYNQNPNPSSYHVNDHQNNGSDNFVNVLPQSLPRIPTPNANIVQRSQDNYLDNNQTSSNLQSNPEPEQSTYNYKKHNPFATSVLNTVPNYTNQTSSNLQSNPEPEQSTHNYKKHNPFATPVLNIVPNYTTSTNSDSEGSDSEEDQRTQSMKQFGVGAILSEACTSSSARKVRPKPLNPDEMVLKPYKKLTVPMGPPKPETIVKKEINNTAISDVLKDLYPDAPENVFELIANEFCTYCIAPVIGLQSVLNHFNSRKHQSRLDFYGMPTGLFHFDVGEAELNQKIYAKKHDIKNSMSTASTSVKRCDICKVDFINEEMAESHYKSQLHDVQSRKQRVQRRAKSEFYCELCGIDASSAIALQNHFNGKKHRALLNVQTMGKTSNDGVISEKEFKCDICQITCVNDETLELHFLGKRHRDTVRKLNQTDNSLCTPKPVQIDNEYDSWLFSLPLSETFQHLEDSYRDMPVVLTDIIVARYCHFCQLGVDSFDMSIDHFNSEVHQQKMRFYGMDCGLYEKPVRSKQDLPCDQESHEVLNIRRIPLANKSTYVLRKCLEQNNIPENFIDLCLDKSCFFCNCSLEYLDEALSHYHSTQHQDQLGEKYSPLDEQFIIQLFNNLD